MVSKKTKEYLGKGIAIVGNILLILTIAAFAKGKTHSLMMAVGGAKKTSWQVTYPGTKTAVPLAVGAGPKGKWYEAYKNRVVPARSKVNITVQVKNTGNTAGAFRAYTALCLMKGGRIQKDSCGTLRDKWLTQKKFAVWRVPNWVPVFGKLAIEWYGFKEIPKIKEWKKAKKSISYKTGLGDRSYWARVTKKPIGPIKPGKKVPIKIKLKIPEARTLSVAGGKHPKPGDKYELYVLVQDYSVPSKVFTHTYWFKIANPSWELMIDLMRYSLMGVGALSGGASLIGVI